MRLRPGGPARRVTPPERTAAEVYFTSGRASRVRRRGRSGDRRYPALAMRPGLLIFAALVLAGCDSGGGRAPATQSRLEAAVASRATSFDFAADSKFAWDRMHVLGCYSDRASVEKELGFAWPEFGKTTIESSDSVVLVVFVQNGKVVGWYEQPRSVELGGLVNGKGYPRSEVRFAIDRARGRPELIPHLPTTGPLTPG